MRRPYRHLLCATLRRGLSFALVVLLIFSPGLGAGWDFNAISTQTERLYGPATPAARQRIDEWAALLKNPPQGTIQDKLNQVNRFFNARMAFKDDIVVWHQQDYWATPIEFLRKGAGDCEDFALAKYFTLREMGVPANQLRITYVKALQLNQAHMVVTWYATPDAIPLVLDNLKPPSCLPHSVQICSWFMLLMGKGCGCRNPAGINAWGTVNDSPAGRIFSPECVQKDLKLMNRMWLCPFISSY